MKTRTSKRVVTFRHPFVPDSSDQVLPAGEYNVEMDEEVLEGISFTACRRLSTVIHLHPNQSRPGVTRTLIIEPAELVTALERDRARTACLAEAAVDHKTPRGEKESHLNAVDQQAIERAENEGMYVHPR